MESLTMSLEFGAQLPEVVNLAVVGDPDVRARVLHRLVPAWTEINDREPTVAKPDAARYVQALVIGTAMRDQVGHRLDKASVDRTAGREVVASNDPAHG